MAILAYKDKENAIMTWCDKLSSLLVIKNRDYGNSAFTRPEFCPTLTAEQALFLRLNDKVRRLKNLILSKNQHLVDESLDDTLFDMAGYCILLLIEREHACKEKEQKEEKDKGMD